MIAAATRRRVLWRLMPFLMLVYLMAYVDRANLSVAAIQMGGELGFDDRTIGLGAGIFFLGYLILEIPGSLIVEKWSARKWIARIMISWGIVAALCGFLGRPLFGNIPLHNQFYGMRFLLGAAEAGFFPGVIVYLSHWFPAADRTQAKALFMVTQPVALLVGVPLSRWLMECVGWRMLFVLEGLPSVVLGLVTLFYLTDRPGQAKWLEPDERTALEETLKQERQMKTGARASLAQPQVILLVIVYFLIVGANQGLVFFLPSLVEGLPGLSVHTRTWLTALPYFCGVCGILAFGFSAYRWKEQRWHTATPMILNAAAFACLIASSGNLPLTLVSYALVGLTLQSYLPAFWTIPTLLLGGSTAAVAVGLINSIGNLGGFAGPYLFGYLRTATGGFEASLWAVGGATMMAGILALGLRTRRISLHAN